MKNQHRQITGYRDLSQEEIDLMNRVKDAGAGLENLIAGMRQVDGIDGRWLSIAQTDLQKGLMALVRSLAKPTSF